MSQPEIDALHAHLLAHHKLLLDATRAEYEREQGPVASAGAFLQLLIRDDAFAWLRPLSGLLVELDDPKLTPDAATARTKVERLFGPETPAFHPRHLQVLAKLPEAARSHEQALQMVAALGRPPLSSGGNPSPLA